MQTLTDSVKRLSEKKKKKNLSDWTCTLPHLYSVNSPLKIV